MKIKFNQPYQTGNELKRIKKIINQKWTRAADGFYSRQVIKLLSKRYKVKKIILTNSGTSALKLAFKLLELKPKDEVILPSFNFPAGANAALQQPGIKLKFCEINPQTYNLELDHLTQLITSKTKVIMPVHYAGVACPMDEILNLSKNNNIKIIEDAAHAIEAKYKNKQLGTIGDLGCFSFHEAKNISCGLGGAVFINQQVDHYFQQAEIIRDNGTNRAEFMRGNAQLYQWVGLGDNYDLSNVLAALLYDQLVEIEIIQAKRMKIWQHYYKHLLATKTKNRFSLPIIPVNCQQNGHIFYLIMASKKYRDSLIKHLRANNIECSFHYIPLHLSTKGQSLGYKPGDLPITEEYSQKILRLPIHSSMTIKQANYVLDNINNWLKK